jgi:hypothetical protein
MAINSTVTVASLLGTVDNSIKIIKTINQPFIKQFVVISKKSTTSIKPNLYTVKIESNTPELKPTSKIKCYCNCLDFRYRMAYCFHEKGALLSVPDYVIEPPDKTNAGCQKFRGCKHIKASLKYGLERGL